MHQDHNKENINCQNSQQNTFVLKKKIEKKMTPKRYMTNKTMQAIRRLTLDLQQKILKPEQ